MKVDIECFGYNNFLQDFKFIKSVVKIAMDVILLLFYQTSIAIFTILFISPKESYYKQNVQHRLSL